MVDVTKRLKILYSPDNNPYVLSMLTLIKIDFKIIIWE